MEIPTLPNDILAEIMDWVDIRTFGQLLLTDKNFNRLGKLEGIYYRQMDRNLQHIVTPYYDDAVVSVTNKYPDGRRHGYCMEITYYDTYLVTFEIALYHRGTRHGWTKYYRYTFAQQMLDLSGFVRYHNGVPQGPALTIQGQLHNYKDDIRDGLAYDFERQVILRPFYLDLTTEEISLIAMICPNFDGPTWLSTKRHLNLSVYKIGSFVARRLPHSTFKWRQGKRDGWYIHRQVLTSNQTIARGYFDNGRENGKFTYQQDDIKAEFIYDHGVLRSSTIDMDYHGDNVISKRPYRNGLIHGVEKFYNQHNKVLGITRWHRGQRQGKQFIYDDKGEVCVTIDWNRDVKVSETHYDLKDMSYKGNDYKSKFHIRYISPTKQCHTYNFESPDLGKLSYKLILDGDNSVLHLGENVYKVNTLPHRLVDPIPHLPESRRNTRAYNELYDDQFILPWNKTIVVNSFNGDLESTRITIVKLHRALRTGIRPQSISEPVIHIRVPHPEMITDLEDIPNLVPDGPEVEDFPDVPDLVPDVPDLVPE